MSQINNETRVNEFDYKKIASHDTKLNCISYTFNNNSTVLFIGYQFGNIKIFAFNQRLRQIQQLQQHKNCVTCLVFQKKTNQLISGSGDKLIIIWNQDQFNQWQPHQILSGHIDWINCIIMNESQDLLISGGEDKAIKFWRKENSSWSILQTFKLHLKVVCMSLNFSEKKLISGAFWTYYYAINVIECQADQQWLLTQTIKFHEKGLRLGFINDNSFFFQPQMEDYLETYNFEEEKKQFIKGSQIQMHQGQGYDSYYYFPPQFIRQKNIFVVKRDLRGNLLLKQSMKFNESYLFGRLTDDGKYLITWDSASNQIQAWKQRLLS